MLNFLSRLEVDWLILGDKSRFVFEKWLHALYNSNPEIIDLEHFKIPIDAENWKEEAKNFQCCAIFEEVPFGKESTNKILNEWIKETEGKFALIVFMDLPRRQGSTDLDKIGDDLRKAQEQYHKQGQNFCTLKTKSNVFDVLFYHAPFYSQQIYKLNNKLELLKDDIEFEFESYYEYFLDECRREKGCLSEVTKAAICSLTSVKKYINVQFLWQCYNEAAKEKLFSKEGAISHLSKINKIYLNDILSTFDGDIGYIDENLIKSLKSRFNMYMRPSQTNYQGTITSRDIEDDISYTKLTENKQGRFYGIKTAYLTQYREFVEVEAKEVLKIQLESTYEHFRKALCSKE